LGETAHRAFELAKAFGAPYLVRPNTGFYIAPGVLCVEATKAGIPAFTFEVGEGGRLEPDMIQEGVRCVRNALRYLRMIPGELEPPKQVRLMTDFVNLRAKRGGLLHTEVELGAEVKRGDLLARVFDIYGDEVERFTAPHDAIFIRSTTLSTVATGERVATLGVPE
jgi:predicted deacylase